MEVNQITKEICDKYPEVYKKFKVFINNKLKSQYHYIQCHDNQILIQNNYIDEYCFEMPFFMLYGLLENFFEENGIIIEIRFYIHDAEIEDYYNYKITYDNGYVMKDKRQFSKPEAKYQAVLKACEILEQKLTSVTS